MNCDQPPLVTGDPVVAAGNGYSWERDEVWRGSVGSGGGFLVSVVDDDLSVLRQTEVSSVVIDATHPSFTGIWQRVALVDVC